MDAASNPVTDTSRTFYYRHYFSAYFLIVPFVVAVLFVLWFVLFAVKHVIPGMRQNWQVIIPRGGDLANDRNLIPERVSEDGSDHDDESGSYSDAAIVIDDTRIIYSERYH